MTLKSRLNCEMHIDRVRVKAKAKRVLNTIKVEGDQKFLKNLFSAICMSKVYYGCQLYSTASPEWLKKSRAYRDNVLEYT